MMVIIIIIIIIIIITFFHSLLVSVECTELSEYRQSRRKFERK